MAATDKEEAYRISAKQLVDDTRSRPVIPCTLSSDIGLSGGIPLGATVLLGGRPKLGKTTLALQYAANAQKLYGSKIYFFPIEGRLTNQTISQVKDLKLGEKDFEVVLPPPIYGKKKEIVGYKKWHAGLWWDVIGETITNNTGDIIIVDSISALSSEKEQSEDMGYQGRGDTQKLEAQFCRKFSDLIINRQMTVFFLAQIQANTSGYGAATQIKAGNAIRHQSDVILFGKGAEKWKPHDGRVKGHDMMYTVECSALGPPFMDLKIPLRYGIGIDIAKDIMNHAITWDIIKKEGSWYTVPFVAEHNPIAMIDLDKLDKDEKAIRFQGEENMWEWFYQHPEQAGEIEAVIRKRVLG